MSFEVRPGSKSLFAKLRAVMEAIDHIEKGGRNTQQAYDYVKAEDLFDEVRQEFIKNGLVVFPACVGTRLIEGATKSGTVTYLTETDMEYTLCDVDTGDTITVPWKGQGQDSGDKGIYKAFTGAGKTFFKALAMIPAGDDPEDDGTPAKTQAPARTAPPARPPSPSAKPPATPPQTATGSTTGAPPTEAECTTLLDECKLHKGGGTTLMQALNSRGLPALGTDQAVNRRTMLSYLLGYNHTEFDALRKKIGALPKEG